MLTNGIITMASAGSKDQEQIGNKEQTRKVSFSEDVTSIEAEVGAEGRTPTEKDKDMEWLRKYFAKSMGINFFDPVLEPLIDEVSFEGVARYLASDKCCKVVTMVGAGISTSAGIPDYRSPNTGLLDIIKEKYNLEDPQAIFQYDYFKDHPEPFYKFRKDMWRHDYKPTPTHYFIKLLQMKNKLLRHFTQNIDGLERMVGLDKENVIEVHGTMEDGLCQKCFEVFTKDDMKKQIMKGEKEGLVPYCTVKGCDGVIRPDIVFFGESLPNTFKHHREDIEKCDLLLIMGTGLTVQPFANLPVRAQDNVPRLYINMEKTGATATHPMTVLFFGGGFKFDAEDNTRDVFWQGKCDDGCYALADLMGWGEEFRTLVIEGNAKYDMVVKPPSIGFFQQPQPKPETTKQSGAGTKQSTNSPIAKSTAKTSVKPTTKSQKPTPTTGTKSSTTGPKSSHTGQKLSNTGPKSSPAGPKSTGSSVKKPSPGSKSGTSNIHKSTTGTRTKSSAPNSSNSPTSGAKSSSSSPTSSANESGGTGKEEKESPKSGKDMNIFEFMARNDPTNEPKPESLLEQVTLEGIVKYIKSGKCKNIVTLAGAGISTSAGIPDYRSPKTGLLDTVKEKYNLPNPEAVFQYSYFKENPEPFFKFRKDMWSLDYKPTPTHYFIKLLEKKKKLARHFTQNIDGLERMAGLNEDKLIEVHGTMDRGYCLKCLYRYTKTDMKKQIISEEEEGLVPYCKQKGCDGVIRPAIVFFGENLPPTFKEHLPDVEQCDLLIVMGTALAVQPFASLPNHTKNNIPRLMINLEKPDTSLTGLFFGSSFQFDDEDNIRDVFWQGKCDDGCYALADLLGWGEEFQTLVKTENAKHKLNVNQPAAGTSKLKHKTSGSKPK